MQKYFGFIVALDDYSQFYRTNKELIENISKKFENISIRSLKMFSNHFFFEENSQKIGLMIEK